MPTLVIGAGMDDVVHPSEARRTADLLGATYEYFPGASHFGLVMGSEQLAAGGRLGARLARGAAARDGRLARPEPPRLARSPFWPGQGRLLYSGPSAVPLPRPVPHSSRGLGHRPLKAEITGSNPVCGTKSTSEVEQVYNRRIGI